MFGNGVCLFWSLSWDGEIEGDCFDLSNAEEVNEYFTEGGEISTMDTTTFCIGDSIPDLVDVTLEGAEGENSAWVITDDSLNILNLPAGPPFDFDGAEEGVCLIRHLSWGAELNGAEIGANAADLTGDCFELSNPIEVIRQECPSVMVALEASEGWNPQMTITPNPSQGSSQIIFETNENFRTLIEVYDMIPFNPPNAAYNRFLFCPYFLKK